MRLPPSVAKPPEPMGEVVSLLCDAESTRALENAVIRLVKSRPFYGHLLLKLHRRFIAHGAPVGVTFRNGSPTLVVCATTLSACSAQEQEALLEHILKHLIHLHPLRRRERHASSWDVACDLAINPTIVGLPSEALLPARFKLEVGLAAEEYYQHLAERFDSGNLDGHGVGDAEQDVGGVAGAGEDDPRQSSGGMLSELLPVDNHAVWYEADSTPSSLGEEAVRAMVREAYQRSGGEIPDDLRLLVEALLLPSPIPWRQVLGQFVATAGRVGRKSTWKHLHRRFLHDTPGVRKRRRLNLLVGVDVSDSTAELELREAFAQELLQIARGRDCMLTVLYAGSRIQRIDRFSSSNAVVEVFTGGGFTDLRPVFDYALTMQPSPAAIIYLTDGYGVAPETMLLPTLWVLSREGRMPTDWGVELRMDA